jgi:hypothetical protein
VVAPCEGACPHAATTAAIARIAARPIILNLLVIAISHPIY